MRKRRICWPKPDKVCLEGGCLYCNDNSFLSVEVIRMFAEQEGLVKAFDYGERRNWNNAESKSR